MKFLDKLIGNQIRKPSGFLGKLLGHLMAADHKEITEWTFNHLHLEENSTILDIGCGSGLAVEKLNCTISNGYIVGIDYSPTMLQQAYKRNRNSLLSGRMVLCHGTVSNLPFADMSFDRICSIETFYFWPDRLNNLREVKRLLKPGGYAAFTMDISKEGIDKEKIADNARRLGFPIYSGEEMKDLLLKAGFIDVRYYAIPEREKGWLCAVGKAPV